jgi:class 3 adenylate cyclase
VLVENDRIISPTIFIGENFATRKFPTLIRSECLKKYIYMGTNRFRQYSPRICHSVWYNGLVILFLVFAVFAADVRNCLATEISMTIFNILIYVTLGFLFFDICLRSVAETTYVWSFYFLLDIVATSLMVLEIPALYVGSFSTSATSIGRAARIGISAAILIRLIHVGPFSGIPSILLAIPTASNTLEGRLAYKTITWVVASVFVFVFAAPLISVGTYYDVYQPSTATWLTNADVAFELYLRSCDSSAFIFYQQQLLIYPNSAEIIWVGYTGNSPCNSPQVDTTLPVPQTASADFVAQLSSPWDTTCSDGSVVPSGYIGVPLTPNLCPVDVSRIYRKTYSAGNFLAVIDTTQSVQDAAFLSIYRSIAIILIVGICVYYAYMCPYDLVLEPVRRILSRLTRVREDPVACLQSVPVLQTSPTLVRFKKASNPFSKWYWKRRLAGSSESAMEIAILERRVFQFANLLAVGFGAAGADIVRRNMTTSELDAMIPGSRVDAIFVHIRVENFQTITSVLHHKVVKFINIVSGIIHGIADEFCGTANKTDGETFSLVWELDKTSQPYLSHDMALTACAKICIAINRSLELREYTTYPPLIQKLPNFSVKLKFGIHKGWAIQGAIGSNLKIDPRYLSADVNTAELLERFNADLGTTILVSGDFLTGCSEEIRTMHRLVDKVKGKRGQVSVYSFDLDTDRALDPPDPGSSTITARQRADDRAWRKKGRLTSNMYDVLNSDRDFLNLREKYSSKFFDFYKNGLLNYLSGEWMIAKTALEQISHQAGFIDQPSLFVLKYMEKHSYEPPKNWDGNRPVSDNGDSLGYCN